MKKGLRTEASLVVALTCTYSTQTDISTNYLAMRKAYTDVHVGGINKLYHGCSPGLEIFYSQKLHAQGKPCKNYSLYSVRSKQAW